MTWHRDWRAWCERNPTAPDAMKERMAVAFQGVSDPCVKRADDPKYLYVKNFGFTLRDDWLDMLKGLRQDRNWMDVGT